MPKKIKIGAKILVFASRSSKTYKPEEKTFLCLQNLLFTTTLV